MTVVNRRHRKFKRLVLQMGRQASTPRPSAYDNTSMSDKSVDEEALQDDLLATQMQATASYLSGNISPQQKAAAIAAFHAMLSVAEGESEAKPLDLTESPPKSLMTGRFLLVFFLSALRTSCSE